MNINLISIYAIANQLFFNGELPITKIIEQRMPKFSLGCFYWNTKKKAPVIKIDKRLPNLVKIEVLIHEMIHASVLLETIEKAEKNPRRTYTLENEHGKSFQKKHKSIFGKKYVEDQSSLVPLWLLMMDNFLMMDTYIQIVEEEEPKKKKKLLKKSV